MFAPNTLLYFLLVNCPLSKHNELWGQTSDRIALMFLLLNSVVTRVRVMIIVCCYWRDDGQRYVTVEWFFFWSWAQLCADKLLEGWLVDWLTGSIPIPSRGRTEYHHHHHHREGKNTRRGATIKYRCAIHLHLSRLFYRPHLSLPQLSSSHDQHSTGYSSSDE